MKPLSRRTGLILGLWSLPIIGLVGLWGYLLVSSPMAPAPLPQLPAPRWTLIGQDTIGGVYNAHELGSPSLEWVSPVQPDVISACDAERIADQVIGPSKLGYAQGPTLFRATFPDGNRRLTWLRTVLTEIDWGSEMGKATALFLDAHDGAPLAVIQDIPVGDPAMSRRFWTSTCTEGPDPLLTFVLPNCLVGYVVLSLAEAGVLWCLRWWHSRHTSVA
jgi:hypothetical protein